MHGASALLPISDGMFGWTWSVTWHVDLDLVIDLYAMYEMYISFQEVNTERCFFFLITKERKVSIQLLKHHLNMRYFSFFIFFELVLSNNLWMRGSDPDIYALYGFNYWYCSLLYSNHLLLLPSLIMDANIGHWYDVCLYATVPFT